MKLQEIFENMKNNNIYVNLDDSYCATTNIMTIKKEYIGYIYSISDIEEVMECIIEEGSATITYCFYECSKLFKNKDIFTELIVSFFNGFEIKLYDDDNQKKIEVIITSENISKDFIELWKLNNVKEESDDEYICNGDQDNIDETDEETDEEKTDEETEEEF